MLSSYKVGDVFLSSPLINSTGVSWTESLASLTISIKTALSNKLQRCPWQAIDQKFHLELLDNPFDNVEHNFQRTVKRLELNVSTILDRFNEGQSSSPLTNGDFTFEELFVSAHFLQHSLPFNYSSHRSDEDLLLDIQREVNFIESWEDEAKKLTLIALARLQNLKFNTSNIRNSAFINAFNGMNANASTVYDETMSKHAHRKLSRLENTIKSADNVWESAGIVIENQVSPGRALDMILSIPLMSYRLRDDKKRDIMMNKTVFKTRFHVGPLANASFDGAEHNYDGIANGIQIDHTTIFSLNIGAVNQLAKSIEKLKANIYSVTSFLREISTVLYKLSAKNATAVISDGTLSSFKSPMALAWEVAALESEAALGRLLRYSQSAATSTKFSHLGAQFIDRLESLAVNDRLFEKISMIERESEYAREKDADRRNANLEILLIYFDTIDQLQLIWNSTVWSLQEIEEAAKIESRVAKEEIVAETMVERENEHTSLEQIKLVGNARVEEMMQAIESIVWHLKGCFLHIISTREGKDEFLFYVLSAGALVFSASTLKEIISLGCIVILRFLTAPKLVREYGNLSSLFKYSWRNSIVMDEIVLSNEIKERLDKIIKVASAASERRFPLQNILIHGKPGCGKSMIAKSLAQSIPSLPYALMSGGDVFPMKRQGPAELRRLLSWASSRKYGGIIIIDEAECALGSRVKFRKNDDTFNEGFGDKKKSSATAYSRDCLNVILSMTGTFGNIMLILTTSNPSQLDEAVLDRMDEIIFLPLPSEFERYTILRNSFSNIFGTNMIGLSNRFFFLSLIRSRNNVRIQESFNVERCLSDLAKDSKTKGFSGREVKKIIQIILHKTCGSRTGVLDELLWNKVVNGLCKSFNEKHHLKISN